MPRFTDNNDEKAAIARISAVGPNEVINAAKVEIPQLAPVTRKGRALKVWHSSIRALIFLGPFLFWSVLGIIFTLFYLNIISATTAFITLNTFAISLLFFLWADPSSRKDSKLRLLGIFIVYAFVMIGSFLYFAFSPDLLKVMQILAGLPLYGSLIVIGALALTAIIRYTMFLPQTEKNTFLKSSALLAFMGAATFAIVNALLIQFTTLSLAWEFVALAATGAAILSIPYAAWKLKFPKNFFSLKPSSKLIFKNRQGEVLELVKTPYDKKVASGTYGQVEKWALIKKVNGQEMNTPVAVKKMGKGKAYKKKKKNDLQVVVKESGKGKKYKQKKKTTFHKHAKAC